VECSKSFSWIVTISDVLADMSMMSISPWATISRIWSRKSAREAKAPVGGLARCGNAKGHVGVLGVSENEGAVG
jgi:hypothetical protein